MILNQVETSTCFVVDKVLELACQEFPYWQQHTQPKSGFHLCPYPIHWRHIQSNTVWSHNVHYFLPRNKIWLTLQKFVDKIKNKQTNICITSQASISCQVSPSIPSKSQTPNASIATWYWPQSTIGPSRSSKSINIWNYETYKCITYHLDFNELMIQKKSHFCLERFKPFSIWILQIWQYLHRSIYL